MDTIRIQADRYFNKSLMDTNKLHNSELYENFFNLKNYNFILNEIESRYDVKLTNSYMNDVFRIMLTCFEYHPLNLVQLNDLVFGSDAAFSNFSVNERYEAIDNVQKNVDETVRLLAKHLADETFEKEANHFGNLYNNDTERLF